MSRLHLSAARTLGAFAVLLPAIMIGAASPAMAQQTPPPSVCENNAGFGQFDFWVGNWGVFNKAGNQAGTNEIVKTDSNCLIREHWTSTSGGTGFSMNFYDPIVDQWRQVWVSKNINIDYTGGLNDEGQMVLEGEIHYYANGNNFPFRGTWTANEDGSVTQHFEQYNPTNETWSDWFVGKYVRQE